VGGVYDDMVDRESAYEELEAKTAKLKEEADKAEAKEVKEKTAAKKKKTTTRKRASGRRKKTATDHILHEVKLVGRQMVRSQGRRILRGILGGMMRR